MVQLTMAPHRRYTYRGMMKGRNAWPIFLLVLIFSLLYIQWISIHHICTGTCPSPTNDDISSSSASSSKISRSAYEYAGYATEGSSPISTSHAVIHMGPHKTGSTSIQTTAFRKLRKELKLDRYELMWDKVEEFEGPDRAKHDWMQDGAHFAHCFVEHGTSTGIDCDPNYLLYGLTTAEKRYNLFVTLEGLDYIEEKGANMLRTYLSNNWDQVTIIVYYRRYYSWFISLYNQMAKIQSISDRPSLLNFIDDLSITIPKHYTSPLIQRLTSAGLEKNIKLINYHDESHGSLDKTFFCHAMPNADNACKGISNMAITPRENKSSTFDYDDIALGAKKAGMLHFDDTNKQQTKKIVQAIQHYQETTLALTTHDFPRVCPKPQTLNKIWDISLDTEKSLFPNLFEGVLNDEESDLRKDFDLAAKTSLCVVDVDTILQDDGWKSFFKSVKV